MITDAVQQFWSPDGASPGPGDALHIPAGPVDSYAFDRAWADFSANAGFAQVAVDSELIRAHDIISRGMAARSNGTIHHMSSFAAAGAGGDDHNMAIGSVPMTPDTEALIIRHAQSMVNWYRGLTKQLELDMALPDQAALKRSQVVPLGLNVLVDNLGELTNILLVRVRNADGLPLSFHDAVGLVFPDKAQRVLQQIICPVGKAPRSGATVQTIYSDSAFDYEIKHLAKTGVVGFHYHHQRGLLFRLMRDAVVSVALSTSKDTDPTEIEIFNFEQLPPRRGLLPGRFRVETSIGNILVKFCLNNDKRLPYFDAKLDQ